MWMWRFDSEEALNQADPRTGWLLIELALDLFEWPEDLYDRTAAELAQEEALEAEDI